MPESEYCKSLECISTMQLKLLCDSLRASEGEVLCLALARLQFDVFMCPAALQDTLSDLRRFNDVEEAANG